MLPVLVSRLVPYDEYFLAVLGVCRKNLLFLEAECNNCTANLACARAWSRDASDEKCARGSCTKILRHVENLVFFENRSAKIVLYSWTKTYF